MSDLPRIDPGDHVVVMAALGRLGMQGGWDRLRAGGTIGALDRTDADLLVAAGLLERTDVDHYRVTDPDLVDLDGDTVGHAMVAQLRRALEHVDRRAVGWEGASPETVLSQGRSSRAAAELMARELLPLMPGSRDAFGRGPARFLDVGVGVAAIPARLCQLYPQLNCVGIDLLPDVLALAASELEGLGLSGRVELRVQSVAELDDEAVFDLAWVAQPFIPPTAFRAGLPRVHRALRPDRWVVVPLAVPETTEPLEQAVFAHTAHMLGGGPITFDDAKALFAAAGFDQVTPASWRGQVVLLARRP
jgi:methyltransferase family protein